MKRLMCIFALVATALADSEAIFKKSNDQFTANMFQEVVKSQTNKSCVMSAFSVLPPLAQLALASVGESHDEILKAIGFTNDNITKEVFSDLNKRLRSIKGIDLELANKVYVRKDYSINDKFANVSKEVFNSEVENIDFQQKAKAAAKINSWVENHTHKRIKNLVKPSSIHNSTAAILINSIYFKGHWRNPFEKYFTGNRSFHVTKNRTSSLPTMSQTDIFQYAASKQLDAQFLKMEYEDSEASFVVALPNKIDGIKDLIEKFKDPSGFNKALKEMYYERVQVYLPKFKIETTTNLKDILMKMNIKDLFQEKGAKLYNLLKEAKDLYVSDAAQKAFIEVNEYGAEAAVANVFDMIVGNSLIEYSNKPIVFNADHPFVFFILEKDDILFSGVFRSI